jgi:translin
MSNFDADIESIVKNLVKKQKDFDSVMTLVRDIVRGSAQTITLLHNNDTKNAIKTLNSTNKLVKDLQKYDSVFGYHAKSGYQEYAEAKIFSEIKAGNEIPSYTKVGVDEESYMMGLMDVMGELKREILEALRENKAKEAEEYFKAMRKIYDGTRSIRFAEAVLNGFRRKQDVARIQLESAGSELLSFKSKRG